MAGDKRNVSILAFCLIVAGIIAAITPYHREAGAWLIGISMAKLLFRQSAEVPR